MIPVTRAGAAIFKVTKYPGYDPAAKISKRQILFNALVENPAGKSPGETLRRFGQRAYTLEAQRQLCTSCFNYKYGRGRWVVRQWCTRLVSARVSKKWPQQLRQVIDDTTSMKGVLAAASVDRMLRTARDWMMVQESKVKILICNDSNLDTSTPEGKRTFGKRALDAQFEAESCGDRVRKALVVARKRGKKFGTCHPKTKGKSAKSQHASALERARALLPHVGPLIRKGLGPNRIISALNLKPQATKINKRILEFK